MRFFGAYANQNYFNKINKRKKKSINKKIPDFDVLAKDPKITSILVQQKLKSYGFMDIKIVKGVETIAPHYESSLVMKHYYLFMNLWLVIVIM